MSPVFFIIEDFLFDEKCLSMRGACPVRVLHTFVV